MIAPIENRADFLKREIERLPNGEQKKAAFDELSRIDPKFSYRQNLIAEFNKKLMYGGAIVAAVLVTIFMYKKKD